MNFGTPNGVPFPRLLFVIIISSLIPATAYLFNLINNLFFSLSGILGNSISLPANSSYVLPYSTILLSISMMHAFHIYIYIK